MAQQTIPSAVDRAVARWPDDLWLRFGGTEITYADMRRRVGEIMLGLDRVGVRRGSRVGLHLGNCAEWLLVELAVTSLGAWLVPLNTMLRPAELRRLLEHSACDTLVWGRAVHDRDPAESLAETVPDLEEAGRGLTSRALPSLRRVIGFGDERWPAGVTGWDDVVLRPGADDLVALDSTRRSVSADDVALVIYTSGTTGAPKGVLQTHGAMNAAIERFAARLGLGPGDRSIFASPLFWIHGCWHQLLVPLHCGSALVLEPRFEPDRFLRTIVEQGCTHLQGVPTQYEMVLGHDSSSRYDLSGLRVVQVGGSTFSPTLLDRLQARAPRARFLAAYGLSEAGVVTWTEPGDAKEDVATTVGHVHEGGAAAVLDEETDQPLGPGRAGEVGIRSDCVMKGYLDDPEATARALRGGWLHTGDLGIMDERGYIRILGRNQDAYKRGGATVYAAEIETVLSEHPGVAEVAVVGVADALLGQVGVAFVVPGEAHGPSAEELTELCRRQLASYKVPSDVRFVASLPRTASGKVRKFALRADYEAARPAEPEDKVARR